jgi:hypothetical protein
MALGAIFVVGCQALEKGLHGSGEFVDHGFSFRWRGPAPAKLAADSRSFDHAAKLAANCERFVKHFSDDEMMARFGTRAPQAPLFDLAHAV